MPASCGIVGCTSRGIQSKFFSIPKVIDPASVSYHVDENRVTLSQKRNKLWLAAINRKDLLNDPQRLEAFIKNGRICARHFYFGKPALLLDDQHVDWVPRLHLGHGKSTKEAIKEIKQELAWQEEERMARLENKYVAPVEPLAIYIENDNENTEEVEEELSVTSNVTIYECGFCSKKFNAISEINEHIKSLHFSGPQQPIFETKATLLNSVHNENAEPCGKSARQTLIDMLQRLEDFEWCDCSICHSICSQFSLVFEEHVTNTHAYAPKPFAEKNGTNMHAKALAPLFIYLPRMEEKQRCVVCQAPANDYGALLDHYKEHVPKIEKPPEPLHMFKPKLATNETPKKVLFKIRKSGGLKMFVCMVCKASLATHEDMLEHFKMHLKKKQLPVADAEPGAVAESRIQETILDGQQKVLISLTEYQCAVCADVDYTKSRIVKCIQKHVGNGWPKTLNAGLVWDTLANETNDSGRVPMEAILDRIAISTQQVAHKHDVAVEERNFYYCPACKQYFDLQDEFRRHLTQLHDLDVDAAMVEYAVNVQSVIKCVNCPTENGKHLTFVSIKEAFLHRHQQHFFEFEKPSDQTVRRFVINPDESEVLATGKLKYFVKNCIAEEFCCPCGLMYGLKSLALSCLARHVGLRRYQCDIPSTKNPSFKCNIRFFTSHDLERHKLKVHPTETTKPTDRGCEKIICHICGIPFTRYRIHEHMKAKHETVKVNCPICGKNLVNTTRLATHLRTVHSTKKSKSVRCKGCFKIWSNAIDAKKCLSTHGNAKQPKKIKLQCDYAASSMELLEKHVDERHYEVGSASETE